MILCLTDELEPIAATGSEGAGLLPIVADIGRRSDIDDVFETLLAARSTVDLLVNNAADLNRRKTLDEHEELLDHQLAVNVTGPFLCSQRAARIMRKAGGGAIVNLSSVGATRAHHRGLPYDVTKGAINAITMAMAVDLGRFGIRVNAIGPGVTYTYRADAVDPERRRRVAERIPLQRYGTVDDIAAAVAFLASDDAAYITGQILHVDGGITAQLSPRTEPL
ncbi:MAG: SDR family oxidoreductase [Acidimicrobiia bacterium]|nr:SDR family oxidoreductase [Acidimicrobiia bacterium]